MEYLYFYRLKFDQEKWENIIEESSKEITNINKEFDIFKNKLLLNKFDENRERVNWFKSIKNDSFVPSNRYNKIKLLNYYC